MFRGKLKKRREAVKLNIEFIQKVFPLYQKAAVLTVEIGALGIVLSILVGLCAALILYDNIPVLRWMVSAYIEISRNTPLLIQLFFFYYGLPKIGIRMEAKLCGLIGLGFLGGSYMAEAFRSGLEAVGQMQAESAYSLGFSKLQTMRYIVLPQALDISFPAFMANIIFLLKETSVFSAISLMDLMFTAKDLIGVYAKTSESLFLLVICYLLILLPISLTGIERRLGRHGFGS